MIKQSTGEDWKDAEISLSTAQPDIGASPPQLGVHHIGFLRPRAMTVRYSSRGLTKKNRSSGESMIKDECYECLEDSEDELCFRGGQEGFRPAYLGIKSLKRSYSPPSLEVEVAKVSCVTESVCNNSTLSSIIGCIRTTVQHHLQDPSQFHYSSRQYRTQSDHTLPVNTLTVHCILFLVQVTVAIIDLSPEFSYVSVPKKSPMSFLQGKVKNASSYALLTGPANVFLDNNFLAKVLCLIIIIFL